MLEEAGALWVRADGGADEPCLPEGVFMARAYLPAEGRTHEDSARLEVSCSLASYEASYQRAIDTNQITAGTE